MAYLKFKPLTAEMNFIEIMETSNLDADITNLFDIDEEVIIVCKAVRDLFILTNKRVIIVDYKGIKAFRRELSSIPFKHITAYSIDIENTDTVLELVTASGYVLEVKFSKPIPLNTMYDIYKYINGKILDYK